MQSKALPTPKYSSSRRRYTVKLFEDFRPLALAVAALVVLAGLCSGSMTIYMKVFEHFSMNRNPLLILTAFLLFMGIQFIVLGLLGELNARTYYEAQGKPIYVVRDRINLG